MLFGPSRPVVAVLRLNGVIGRVGPIRAGLTMAGLAGTIERAFRMKHLKAVALTINSPGGSATASEAILLALRELAAEKPTVVSMGRLAASGGYYVTCFGRRIFAEAGTITGSIGVFGMRMNFGPIMRRIGLNEEVVARVMGKVGKE